MSGFPDQPGWRKQAVGETSREAAIEQRKKAPTHLMMVRDELRNGPATCEELLTRLTERGVCILLTTVRARVCQLRALGEVVATDERGLGESGRCKVIRWRLATLAERTAFEAAKEAAA